MSNGTRTPLGDVPTSVPLVLLPVHLETRLVRAGTLTQVLVRIYPDDIHGDSHDPRLTAAERTWGQHFWVQTWMAGDDAARQRSTWRQLADQVGPPRAAFIADTLRPLNGAERPPKPVSVLPVPPTFPAVTPRTDPWSRPAVPCGLPDYWIAIGYAGGRRFIHTGPRIVETLAMAPAMDGSSPGFDAANFEKDPRAGWIVDFAAAEKAGMALRISYDVPHGTTLDRLVVFGVKSGAGSGTQVLQDLVRAHRYATGLSFVPQSTPTNNTEKSKSGYSSSDEGYVGGPLADAAAARLSPGDGSNGDVLSRALGLDVSLLAPLEHASLGEQREAYHMNNALWKATWGYFLEQLMAGSGMSARPPIRLAREHFVSYVRARGPLPTLRVGQQPYGVLPVMSLDRWKPLDGAAIDAPLVRALIGLREVWRRALSAVPRVTGLADAATELVKVLAMRPVSGAFAARQAQPIVPLGTVTGPTRIGSEMGLQLARSLGITWLPRQLRTLLALYSTRVEVTGAVAQAFAPGVATDALPLNPNYLAWLSATGWSGVRGDAGTGRADTLLYLLMRHATLREYVGAATRVLARKGVIPADANVDVDAVDGSSRTPWALLATAVPTLAPAGVGGYLDAIRAQLRAEPARDVAAAGDIWRRGMFEVAPGAAVPPDLVDDLRELAAFDRSLTYLSSRTAAPLARLLAESLDLASYRLDAWMTSMAAKRLEWLRQRAPTGVQIGAYGWVEDVVPVERATVTPPAPPAGSVVPPELSAPMYSAGSTYGYVHAPSLPHATTAAILRSGYLSRKAAGDGNSLAVNLGSRRVRTALWLLEGIRSGQPLGALLGYRFERGLHENHPGLVLDQYIPSFRALAPQSGGLPMSRQPHGPQEAITARNVVDGLALLQRYRSGRNTGGTPSWSAATIPFGTAVAPITVVLPPPDRANAHFAAIEAELQAIEGAVDAVGDVTIAEAVHQVAQGNPERAGAALEAVAMGEAPPPELDVVDTPRTGIGVTHRLVVLFGGAPPATWNASTPRGRAEPQLSAWAGALLGPHAPDAVCRVAYVDTATNAPLVDGAGAPYQRDVKLRKLGLGPLDVLYARSGEGEAQRSELEQRIGRYALQPAPAGVRPPGVPESAGVRITMRVTGGAGVAAPSLADVLEAARAVRELLTSARAIAPADLALPDAVVPPTADADVPAAGEPADSPDRALRLSDRANAAVAAFRTAAAALAAAVPSNAPPNDLDATRTLLMGVAMFGVAGAVPLSAAGSSDEARATLHTQALSIVKEVRERLKRLDALDDTASPTMTPVALRDYDLARLHEIFGEDFRVLPRVTAPDPQSLYASLRASTALQDGKPLEAVTWLQRAARVRDGVARFDLAHMYAEALGGSPLNLKVAQLPLTDKNRWAGLGVRPGTMFPGGLSIVAQLPRAVDVRGPVSGLVVDEWVEVVPNAIETTGLTFHFNRPNARAPQAVLLAVVPDDAAAWDVETLEATLLETLELAKLRTVDPATLGEMEQYLPAIYLAHPAGTDTVTTDFARVATEPRP